MDSFDESSNDTNLSSNNSYSTQYEYKVTEETKISNINVVNKIFNRQLYGRFTKNPRARTEKIYEKIPETCNRSLSDVLPDIDLGSAMQHIYMGFTICGQYLLSYTWTTEEDLQSITLFSVIYYLCVWRYAPGHRLKMVSKQKIFRNYRPQELLDVTFSQWPTDREKVVAYGVNLTHPSDAYITILYLPTLHRCEDCARSKNDDDLVEQPPCLRHSVTIDFMLSITTPFPVYNPVMHLAFPDHIVVNTGHYLHVINVTYVTPNSEVTSENMLLNTFSDNSSIFSDIGDSDSVNTNVKSNIVDAIIQDFSEYDLEGSECSKPFHELNICCEPLNVTGKSYFNTNNMNSKSYLLINAHTSGHNTNSATNKTVKKNEIDKKNAEKCYEFTEDNEKCEKLSSFRKKRLADKKYEFSEDNSENIIPFQLLRQERRFLLRNQNRFLRSPVSPRQNGLRSPRSPMLSPGNRTYQNDGSSRNIYCPSLRLSPGSCRSPISPRENTRKFNVYSPSHIDSDCSDNDSKLILRQIYVPNKIDHCEKNLTNAGLLIVDGKKIEEKPRWIRKVVKRYCNLDFESASLLSDVQGRDDYLCIDLPTLVCTANNNQIDAVPSRMSDDLIGPHIRVTQKTFDFEQFCQRRAEKLCNENKLKFSHCEDYDIKIHHVCPLSGDIICTADLKIGAIKDTQKTQQPQPYTTCCMFLWNMCSDSYKILESEQLEISKSTSRQKTGSASVQSIRLDEVPAICCKKVRYMTHNFEKSLHYLRDLDNYIQISMDKNDNGLLNYSDDEFLDSFNYNSELSDSEDIF